MINKLNQVFRSISNIHDATKEKNTRTKKLTIFDTLLYQFSYSNIHTTKQSIVSDFCFEHFSIHRTSIYRKEQNISVQFYKNLYCKIKELYDNQFTNSTQMTEINKLYNNNFINSPYNIFSVDGTNKNYVSNNKLISELNMCIFDSNGFIPIDMFTNKSNLFINNKNNISNKNNEVNQFIDYINTHKIQNAVFVCDRAYFKYELFNLLETNNLKFVIRIKENSNIINSNFIPSIHNKNYRHILNLKNNPNIRIINYTLTKNKSIVTKTNKLTNITIKNTYHLITNLPTVTDEQIQTIYNSRWNIEVFFKILKTNFKFSYLLEKNDTQRIKLIYIDLIMMYISKIIAYYGYNTSKFNKNKQIKKKNNKIVSASVKFNFNVLIRGIYDKLLKLIINGQLNENIINRFTSSYFICYKNETDRNFPRKSLFPFSKWYVKMYHSIYKYNKIIDQLTLNTTVMLNKNLKLFAKNIKLS